MILYIVKHCEAYIFLIICIIKNKKGQAYHIAPLQPSTLAAVKPWGIQRELVVWDLPECKGNTFF
ncbi:hypothetical protein HW49_07425 [Porphyromonadaceae bacterium COT-184 OH4590]|nr:hypothetical protein HW49_07425 [Porphyromonadaceae bacterium COT-184 OH4590]